MSVTSISELKTRITNVIKVAIGSSPLKTQGVNVRSLLTDMLDTLESIDPKVKGGTFEANGDSMIDTFVIPHSLGVLPSAIALTPASADMSINDNYYVVTLSPTDITINFAFPPPTGVNNVKFYWILTN